MTRPADYLYDLLPAVYRMRDEQQGYPLRDLLRVVTEQVNVVEDDLAQLYADWFIETCEDRIVPYLGDLVGYRPVSDAGALGPQSGRLARVRVPRRDVANTVASRRRKGTLALLEELAADVSDWPARAVEAYRLLGWTQHLDHRRLLRGTYVDLRSTERLDRLDGPFDDLAHRVDVHRTVSHRGRGLHNVPSVGLFAWRLESYPVTRAPAACIEREGSHCYTFSVLGNDTQLFNRPVPERRPTHIAGELNLPTPIRRRGFEHRLSEHPLRADASTDYYGADRSLVIEVRDWPRRGQHGVIPVADVIPADLSDWHGYRASRGKVLVDPELGRMAFAPGQSPRRVMVGYRYGFSADIGGGEYRRVVSQPAAAPVYRVRQRPVEGEYGSIRQAYERWRDDQTSTGEGETTPRAAVIEVADSGVYEERLDFELGPGEYLQLRAAPLTRPVLRLLDYRVDQPDPFSVRGGTASRFVLDGFLVTGRGIEVAGPDHGDDAGETPTGDLCDVTIRHCTLVPGWDLDCDCTPMRPDEPSLTLHYTGATVVVEHSILGSIWVRADERRNDPVRLRLSDSIVDATSPGGTAVSSGDGRMAFADLTMRRCTVVGEVLVHSVGLVENTILTSRLTVARRQVGCVRYSYVPAGSRTPVRHHCQPDEVVRGLTGGLAERARNRVRPAFDSLRYGTPTYGRLSWACAEEIRRGADDESELGVFHDLYEPQRSDNLRVRLDEYTPAGMDAGIFFAELGGRP